MIGLVAAAPLLLPSPAPATIQEQRDRLPPPVDPGECRDPIAGSWRAHLFYPHVGQWYIFTLAIRRGEGQGLTGSIHAEFWDGNAGAVEPPACNTGGRRLAVFEPATGHWDAQNRELLFEGTSWRSESAPCGQTTPGYLLDHFSGPVDRDLQEFQSVLNADSPTWQNVPTVFRRIDCDDGATVPDVPTPPPPIVPPPPGVGCSAAIPGCG